MKTLTEYLILGSRNIQIALLFQVSIVITTLAI